MSAGPLAAGVLAGWGLALPLGAIGVLLVDRALTAGFAAGLGAAAGVATVDAGYALATALLGGTLAEALTPYMTPLRLTGATVLAVVAPLGLRAAARGTTPAADGGHGPESGGSGRLSSGGAGVGRTYLTFVGLTALNPMTAVYFAALLTGVASVLGPAAGPWAAPAFAAGVAVGSASWHSLLATVGAVVGRGVTDRARRGLALAGHGAVLLYAAGLGWSALGAT